MIPTDFPESNTIHRAPPGFADSQVVPIPSYVGEIARGSCEGQMICVVAWKPTFEDLEKMVNGAPVFLTMFGGLAPHMLTTNFQEATHPA